MSWQWKQAQKAKARALVADKALNEATVALAYATSSTYAKRRYGMDQTLGTPPYTQGFGRLRWGDRVCRRLQCRNLVPKKVHGGRQFYCTYLCEEMANVRRYKARHNLPCTRNKQLAVALRVVRERNASA